MELAQWDDKGRGYMVRVTPDEALRIAASLVEQVRSKNPNTGRPEFHLRDGAYFSICVQPEGCDVSPITFQEKFEVRRPGARLKPKLG